MVISQCATRFAFFSLLQLTQSFIIPQSHTLIRLKYPSFSFEINSSLKSEGDKKEERAGASGYSILRQPLSWDSESDPEFLPPSQLDEKEEIRKENDISSWWGSPDEDVSKSSNVMKDSKSELGAKTLTLDDIQNRNFSNSKKHRVEEFDQTLDLFQRTLDTLDYPYVLNALSSFCTTTPAQILINKQTQSVSKKEKDLWNDDDILNMPLTAQSVDEVHHRYNALNEMTFLKTSLNNSSKQKKMQPPDLDKGGTTLDLQPIFQMAESGQVLEGPEILEVSVALEIFKNVQEWTESLIDYGQIDDAQKDSVQNRFEFKEIPKITSHLDISLDLLTLLTTAFDKSGSLSSITFPEIGSLRSQIRTLKRSILSSLDDILTAPSMQNKLALESGGSLYSEINGRIVIPVADKYKNSVGIMHDSSRSGKTVYVEPTEIVGPTNELKQLEMELKREEARVWRMLTEEIMNERESIEIGVAVVAQLDLVMARMRLGEKLADYAGGVVIPEVKDEGVIHLNDAKHPLLLLRELDNVVGSDIDLGADGNQGLILTGPNSGGKTVILKLMGLMAFMVRDGIPLPASRTKDVNDAPARVDFFDPVLADIGDMQSVDSDLSTFSGHMLVCREVLEGSGKNSLVLMDELGSGTDPAQGVAIAQALLESLMEKGARVAITTHYLQLKQLSSTDKRFAVAGMQFVNNRPTYKLLPGQIGESFALAVAERLHLPSSVISRANALLDQDTRQMGDLIKELESQKSALDDQLNEMELKKKAMEDMQEEMREAKEKLIQAQLNARRDEAKKFAKKLEEKERTLEDILKRLKSDPSRKVLANSWEDIRYVRRDALNEAENVPGRNKADKELSRESELVPLAELRNAPTLKVGDTLVICKKGAMKGKEVKILQLGNKQMQVAVGKMPVQMKLTELALPIANMPKSAAKLNDGRGKDGLSKIARKALAEHAAIGDSSRNVNTEPASQSRSKAAIIKTESNTLDLRGCTFDEGKRKCEDFFSRFVMQKNPVVFILHGHGTGALKKRLREWFKRDKEWVKSFKAADPSDGGDALTQVTLKKLRF